MGWRIFIQPNLEENIVQSQFNFKFKKMRLIEIHLEDTQEILVIKHLMLQDSTTNLLHLRYHTSIDCLYSLYLILN